MQAQGRTKSSIKNTINYSKRFAYILDDGNTTPLLGLSRSNRLHVMRALANLAKFTGKYQQWQEIIKRYNLKWQKEDSVLAFQKMLGDDALDLDTMLQQIRLMMENTPVPMPQIIKYGCLVGLRSSEIIQSVRFINDKEAFARYYDPETQTLTHYKMPGMIRTTKKCLISFVTSAMLGIIRPLNKVPTWGAINWACHQRKIPNSMRLCRKIHATWLHEHGISSEIIDVLEGRTPTSIFARHYYRPSLDYKEKVLAATEQLSERLTTSYSS